MHYFPGEIIAQATRLEEIYTAVYNMDRDFTTRSETNADRAL